MARYTPVRIDQFRRNHFIWCFSITLLIFLGALAVAALRPPPVLVKEPSGGVGTNIDMLQSECIFNATSHRITPVKTMCWNHEFVFHRELTPYFLLGATMQRNSSTQAVAYPSNMRVLWQGLPDNVPATSDSAWVTITEASIIRSVIFGADEAISSMFEVVEATSVMYQRYYVEVQFMDAFEMDYASSTSFQFVFSNKQYETYEFQYKSTWFAIVLLATVASFAWTCYARTPYRITSPDQKWVLLLLVMLLAYNDPLKTWPAVPATATVMLVSQFTFLAAVMLYWLCQFDMLGRDRDLALPVSTFYLPKAIYVGIFYITAVAGYTYAAVINAKNPLWSWHEDRSMIWFVRLWVLLAASYVFIILFYLVRAFRRAFCSSSPLTRDTVEAVIVEATGGSRSRAWLLALHLTVLLLSFGGLVFGAELSMDVDMVLDHLFYHALFNTYLLCLAFLFLPRRLSGHYQYHTALSELEAESLDDLHLAMGFPSGDGGLGGGGAGGSDEQRHASANSPPSVSYD